MTKCGPALSIFFGRNCGSRFAILVPGLAVKPIVDLDIVVRTPVDIRLAIERIEAAGYRHIGPSGQSMATALKDPLCACGQAPLNSEPRT